MGEAFAHADSTTPRPTGQILHPCGFLCHLCKSSHVFGRAAFSTSGISGSSASSAPGDPLSLGAVARLLDRTEGVVYNDTWKHTLQLR